MLSNSCLVLPAVVKQQQEEISRNHVPSLFAVSVVLSTVHVGRLLVPGQGVPSQRVATNSYKPTLTSLPSWPFPL